jgi:tetrahydromethanopterin S-methyltransferase subunit B
MQRFVIALVAILGGTAFLVMVKLMYDMTGHMARMTDQVVVMSADMGQLRSQMETMTEQVTGIRDSVRYMLPLAADVQGMRESVAAMAGVLHKGGEQIERLNPMQMMEQMVAPGQPNPRSGPAP